MNPTPTTTRRSRRKRKTPERLELQHTSDELDEGSLADAGLAPISPSESDSRRPRKTRRLTPPSTSKRERNRASASRYRQRRKAYVSELELQVKQLQQSLCNCKRRAAANDKRYASETTALRQENDSLRQELERLRSSADKLATVYEGTPLDAPPSSSSSSSSLSVAPAASAPPTPSLSTGETAADTDTDTRAPLTARSQPSSPFLVHSSPNGGDMDADPSFLAWQGHEYDDDANSSSDESVFSDVSSEASLSVSPVVAPLPTFSFADSTHAWLPLANVELLSGLPKRGPSALAASAPVPGTTTTTTTITTTTTTTTTTTPTVALAIATAKQLLQAKAQAPRTTPSGPTFSNHDLTTLPVFATPDRTASLVLHATSPAKPTPGTDPEPLALTPRHGTLLPIGLF